MFDCGFGMDRDAAVAARRDGDREGDELADFAPSKFAFCPAALSAKYPLIISGLSWPTSFTPAASCLR
jgi:hypothetical protein